MMDYIECSIALIKNDADYFVLIHQRSGLYLTATGSNKLEIHGK